MPELLALKCPSCGSPLRAEDWNVAAGIVRCGYCHAIASAPKAGSVSASGFQPRPEIPMPPGIVWEQTPDGLSVVRRWFSPTVFFLIPFCIAWDAFLVFWYSMAFKTGAPWIAKVFPVAHVAVGIGLTYFVFVLLFNRTRIRADRRQLSIRSGPVWPGTVEIPSSSIDQLYCKQRVSQGRNGPSVSHELWASLRDGTSRKLLANGLSDDQALYLEQRIEHALGITDRPMPGELPR